jgi:hypothetical protein
VPWAASVDRIDMSTQGTKIRQKKLTLTDLTDHENVILKTHLEEDVGKLRMLISSWKYSKILQIVQATIYSYDTVYERTFEFMRVRL